MLLSASTTHPTFWSHMHATADKSAKSPASSYNIILTSVAQHLPLAGCRDRSSNSAVTSHVQVNSATLSLVYHTSSILEQLEQPEDSILLQLDPAPIFDFVAQHVVCLLLCFGKLCVCFLLVKFAW